jgi:hypothetical protein
MGKDGTAGRRPPRKRLPDPVGPVPHAPPALRGLANQARADQPHRWRERARGLAAHLLRACWEDLHTVAARGVDHGTAEESAAHPQATMAAWAQRLQAQRSRATWVRRCALPKANGQERPRGISARAATWVPLAWAQRLTALYAPDVLEGRDG